MILRSYIKSAVITGATSLAQEDIAFVASFLQTMLSTNIRTHVLDVVSFDMVEVMDSSKSCDSDVKCEITKIVAQLHVHWWVGIDGAQDAVSTKQAPYK